MIEPASIRSADRRHLRDLRRLCRTPAAAGTLDAAALERALSDQTVLISTSGDELLATAALDVAAGTGFGLFVEPSHRGLGLGRQLLVAVERLAVQYGMQHLGFHPGKGDPGFLAARGYQDHGAGWRRSLARRQTRYARRIARLGADCGIPADYGCRHRLRLQPEAHELSTVATEPNGREHLLHPDAARAWLQMQRAADSDGVDISAASAFRSVGYQASIIQRKRQAGQDTEQILSVSAAPGYSEHHTGRAIDIRTPGSPPLETEFEETAAFEWLIASAAEHGFRLSYPRDNRHGILYEPWHWFHVG